MKNSSIQSLHITTPVNWRGGEQQAFYLIEELLKAEQSVKVLCPNQSVMQQRCEKLSLRADTFTGRGIFGFSIAKIIRDIHIKHPLDLIHVHDSHAHTASVVANGYFKLNIPVVVSRRVDFPVSSSILSRWKYNHPNVKKIVCVSEAIRSLTLPSITRENVLEVIYSGVDLNYFSNLQKGKLRAEFSIPSGIKVVMNTSALAEHKDYYTFVDTAKMIYDHNQDVKFFIIGDGSMMEAIKKYIHFHQMDEAILMTGFREDAKELLMDADVFLMTSKTEGLGTSVLDAMACGVPVVATHAGGIPEIIGDTGEYGLMGEVKNPLEMADLCLQLLSDDILAASIATRAKERVNSFSKEYMGQKMLETYREVLNQ